MKHYKKWLGRILPALLLLAPLASQAALVYRFQNLGCGDTCFVSDINDRGDIVMTGNWDGGGGTEVLYGSDYLGKITSGPLPAGTPVIGLIPENPYRGVQVDAIDNQGNMAGFVRDELVADPQTIPVVWIEGIPHDLTDPANAGIPIPTRTSRDLPASFFADLVLLDAPARLRIDGGLTNNVGQLVMTFVTLDEEGEPLHFPGEALLTRVVPEPASLLLLGLGLGAAGRFRRRRQGEGKTAFN